MLTNNKYNTRSYAYCFEQVNKRIEQVDKGIFINRLPYISYHQAKYTKNTNCIQFCTLKPTELKQYMQFQSSPS